MKKNRCFKMTALLLAMVMTICVFPSFALGAQSQGTGTLPTIAMRELDSTFVTSAKIMKAGDKNPVTDLSKEDPNGSFTLKLEVKEPSKPENLEDFLPEKTDEVILYYPLENMIAVSGENDIVSWKYEADDSMVTFKWKNGKPDEFTADISIIPNYPATNDISGSYVLGTKVHSMLGTRSFRDRDKNRDKLFASVFTEADGGIRPITDENPIWVIEHFSGNYYTLRAQNSNKYIYISPAKKDNYLANSLYLVEGTKETAQKILVTDVGDGYYSFTYTHTDGKKYAINNSSNDKVGNSAIRGFGCWTYAGQINEIFKLYSPSTLINSATVDLNGTWIIANDSGKALLTAEAPKANRLAGMKYSMDNGVVVSENDAVKFTFEHVIRDWYTVRTDAGYLNITENGAVISSSPQKLLVLSDDNYASIIISTSEYFDSTEKYCTTYALNFSGEFGTVISRKTQNTRMQLILPSNSANGQTRAFLIFNSNGGTTNEIPNSIEGEEGEKIALPELNGTKNGQEFIGWCELSDAFKKVDGANRTSHTYHDIYTAGSTYTLKAGTNTLYAVYNTTKKNVRFGIRIDGKIQDEPNGFPADKYTGHFWLNDDLKIGKWIVDIDSTKPVDGYTLKNNVTANLNYLPTADQINEALRTDPVKTNLTFDPETQYIHWYVFKYTTTNGGEWHVDGVIRNKTQVGISYNFNVSSEEKAHVKNMPSGQQVVIGSEILIGTNADSTEVLRPYREGYLFNGWNTEPDGSGTSYSEGHYVKLTENLNLYAQWIDIRDGQMLILIKSDWPDGKLGYVGAQITLTAELTGFTGREYDLQWQYTNRGTENWTDIPGANQDTYMFILDEINTNYDWRCVAKNVR